jgi:hypothetical protein
MCSEQEMMDTELERLDTVQERLETSEQRRLGNGQLAEESRQRVREDSQ